MVELNMETVLMWTLIAVCLLIIGLATMLYLLRNELHRVSKHLDEQLNAAADSINSLGQVITLLETELKRVEKIADNSFLKAKVCDSVRKRHTEIMFTHETMLIALDDAYKRLAGPTAKEIHGRQKVEEYLGDNANILKRRNPNSAQRRRR